jgi:hypothetical protein
MPITLAYADADSVLAKRLADDLSAVRLKKDETVLVALISPSAVNDADVLRQIDTANSQGQTIVPVFVQDAALPSEIAHLKTIDFRGGAYPFESLKDRVMGLNAAAPDLKKRNQRAGLVVALIALFIFGVGLYAVGVLGIHAPQEEFEEVETARMDQRNTLIAPTLEPLIPVGQFAISQFEITVTHVPTRLRAYLIQTVTATAQGTFIPTLTPRPTEEE